MDQPAIVVGDTTVYRYSPGHTVVILHDGSQVHAEPWNHDAYRRRARLLGYGADVNRMAFERELLHVLLADWLGLPESPHLRYAVQPDVQVQKPDVLQLEAEAVTALMRLVQAWGVDLSHLSSGGPRVRPG